MADLTPQQQHAAILTAGGFGTWEAVAAEVGVSARALYNWRQLPAWDAAVSAEQGRLHKDIRQAHVAAATEGSRARVVILRKLITAAETAESSEDLARLANAIDRLTTSAEDRSGHPRSERLEHAGTVATETPRTPEELDAEIAELDRQIAALEAAEAL